MKKVKFYSDQSPVIWNRLKALREEEGLTQPQVAVGAGIAIMTLWMIESGYDAKTKQETKQKLANFFKCDIDDIFPAEMIGNQTKEEVLNKIITKK